MRVTFRKFRSDKVVDFDRFIKARYNKFKVSPSFKLSKPKKYEDPSFDKEDYLEILQLIMDSINKDLKFQKSKNENKKEFPTYFS